MQAVKPMAQGTVTERNPGSPNNHSERSYAPVLGGRGGYAPRPVVGRRTPTPVPGTVFTRTKAKIPLALLAMDLPKEELRVLMAMAQGPKEVWWSAENIGAITGISEGAVRVYRARLKAKHLITEVAPRKWTVTVPPTPAATLEALNGLTADRWADSDTEPAMTIKLDGTLDVPVTVGAITLLAKCLPWVLDPASKDAGAFWAFIGAKAKTLLRKCKKADLEPRVAGYLVSKAAAKALVDRGNFDGLDHPARWLVKQAGCIRPRDLTPEVLEQATATLAKHAASQTVSQMLGVSRG